MYYKLIKLELANLAAHTALVEACDWDESQADAILVNVCDFLDAIMPKKKLTWDDLRLIINSYLSNVYGKPIADIIINILDAKSKEIMFYMEMQND